MSKNSRHSLLKRISLLIVIVLLLTMTTVVSASDRHRLVRLQAVGGSGVSGLVNLVAGPHGKGTHINVVAFGLTPGNTYISLYYDNHVCDLEPYSVDDVVGLYTANAGGVGTAEANVTDDLDEINSVSVRRAGDFQLLACANVHP